MHLFAALAALRGRPDRARALQHLLDAWRADHRRPELAQLIEALSREATRSLSPLDPKLGDPDYHAAWIARAAGLQALELELLLPGLERGPLGKRIRERFDLLLPFADDPRVIACFGRMILEPPVMAASNFPLWTQLFASLRAHPDVRLRPLLEQRLREHGGESQFWPMLLQRSLDLLAALPAQLPPPSEPSEDAIEALRARIAELAAGPPAPPEALREGTELERELLAKVYAEPERVDHRLVWADALLERGDARGEFVQLQLARRARDLPPTRREQQLLSQHALAWTGELGAVLERSSLVFEDGFLARGEALFDSATERELLSSPAWATLRELDCDDPGLFMQPQLRTLQRAGGFDLSAFIRLLEHPGPPAALRTLGPVFLDELSYAELRRLRDAPASWLPALDSLWLHVDGHEFGNHAEDFEWVLETPVGARISQLRVSGFPYMSYDSRRPDWHSWAEAFRAGERWRGLERLRVDLHLLGYEFSRAPAGVHLRVFHDYSGSVNLYRRNETQAVLERLLPAIDSLEFVGVAAEPAAGKGLELLAGQLGFEQVEQVHAPGRSAVGQEVWRRLHKLIARQRRAAKRLESSQARGQVERESESLTRARRRQRVSTTGPALPLQRPSAAAPSRSPVHARWLSFVPTPCPGPERSELELLCLARELSALQLPSLHSSWRAGGERHYDAACHDAERQLLWLGSKRGETVLWDHHGCRTRARARFHRKAVTAVGLAPSHDLLLSCDREGKLLSWSLSDALPEGDPDAEPTTMIPCASRFLPAPAVRLALAPDGDTLALLSDAGEVSLARLPELGQLQPLGHVGARASVLRWAPSGDHLIAALPHGGLVIWDHEGAELTRLELHRQAITAACWTPRGELVTAARRVHVTTPVSGRRRLCLDPGQGKITALAVSPDAQLLAVAAAGGLSLWSLRDGRRLGDK